MPLFELFQAFTDDLRSTEKVNVLHDLGMPVECPTCDGTGNSTDGIMFMCQGECSGTGFVDGSFGHEPAGGETDGES